MKRTGCTGVFWLIFATGLSGVPQGEWSAEVRQGELSRLSAAWRPSPGQEGRWWWDPQGGSAWVRFEGFQVGPLVRVGAPEGLRAWGPGSRLSSGNWGLGAEAGGAGAWVVQTPENLEAGAQFSTGWGPWKVAAGGERLWSLGGADAGWTDSAQAGVSWSLPGLSGGLEVTFDTKETPRTGSSGRLSVDSGPWEAEGRASVSSDQAWTGRGRAGWRSKSLVGMVVADRKKGAEFDGSFKMTWAEFSAGTSTEVRFSAGRWTAEGGLSLQRARGENLWSAEWRVGPGRLEWLHQLSAAWKEPLFEVDARWKAEGFRLGWLGPDSSFALTFRSFF